MHDYILYMYRKQSTSLTDFQAAKKDSIITEDEKEELAKILGQNYSNSGSQTAACSGSQTVENETTVAEKAKVVSVL